MDSESMISSSDNEGREQAEADDEAEDFDIAKAETRRVVWSKLLVIAVLVAAAISCAVVTYRFTSCNEIEVFKTNFEDFADEVVEVSQISANNIFETIRAMSITITSHALDLQLEWPMVTIPHFEARGKPLLELSGANYVSLNPIVTNETRSQWEEYSVANQQWIQEGLDYAQPGQNATPISPSLFYGNPFDGSLIQEPVNNTLFSPIWQVAPASYAKTWVNFNLVRYPIYKPVFDASVKVNTTVMSSVVNLGANITTEYSWPRSFFLAPVWDTVLTDNNDHKKMVATLVAFLPWHRYFENLIPHADGICVVIKNTCGQIYSYEINSGVVSYLGVGDHHEPEFDGYNVSSDFVSLVKNIQDYPDLCQYSLHVYPSKVFQSQFITRNPQLYTVIVLLIFLMTSAVFVLYDLFVQRRQDKVMSTAVKSNAIVNSLFPAPVKERLMADDENSMNTNGDGGGVGITHKTIGRSIVPAFVAGNRFMGGPPPSLGICDHKKKKETPPIADLFPHATVLFGDISGFTAWASEREPSQVFVLLEGIYNCFDAVAKKRGVFKVETVGDCYVAATGLPTPRDDHAQAMAKFASECRHKMTLIVRDLEVRLGPGTGDLTMRFGIHSGPVTAGVLRGDKSRFQLFGDTVNVASRIETTGIGDKIHLSKDTAELLILAGKADWVEPRDGMVTAKGKGKIQTYWLLLEIDCPNNYGGGGASTVAASNSTERLIDWNVERLLCCLKKVVAAQCHNAANNAANHVLTNKASLSSSSSTMTNSSLATDTTCHTQVLDEVQEIIDFQVYDKTPSPSVLLSTSDAHCQEQRVQQKVDKMVVAELRDFVSRLADMHNQANPFHNFDHASHCAQSASKLFARIEEADFFGMDPLTQFSCIFSALIHDADHPGVPNSQLVKEGTDIAKFYNNKSVAEQNSFNSAWQLLMEPCYLDLRQCIFQTNQEKERFRQLLINAVMATDIMDKDLSAWRRNRWDAAFCQTKNNGTEDGNTEPSTRNELSTASLYGELSPTDALNRKATIVIEHLIQASDVAHTMQHWKIYVKWNRRLFFEVYGAFLAGRSDIDPSIGWYEGELGFFDYYIIPLAKKLKECGVFGVASDEYLNYAVSNRAEWHTKGPTMVQEYLDSYEQKHNLNEAVA